MRFYCWDYYTICINNIISTKSFHYIYACMHACMLVYEV